MHFGGHGQFSWQFATQFRTHRAALILGTLVTFGYTSLVWWLCHPLVKQFDRLYRKPSRWRLHTHKR